MSLPRALVTVALADAAMERLRAGCEPVVVTMADRPATRHELETVEGLLCSALYPVDATLLDAVPRLRVISNFGVGYNNVDVAELTRRGIAICNTPGVLSGAVADLTMALILAAARGLAGAEAHVRSGAWARGVPPPPLGFDLEGKTLGIIGYGRIGRAVAARARGFGLRIVFNDLFTDPGPGDDATFRPLDALLAEADIVSLHVNLTPETTRLVGARELARMRPTAWLVNTSRGPVVDEAALAAALHAGSIAGAALDVQEVEPLAPDAPILAVPNTILLPHVGSATVETRAAMLDLAIRNLLAVLRREAPPACVNPEALPRALER